MFCLSKSTNMHSLLTNFSTHLTFFGILKTLIFFVVGDYQLIGYKIYNDPEWANINFQELNF